MILKAILTMTSATATAYDPKVSEFQSKQQADSHTAWLRREIETRRNDGAVGVPHAQVMARMDALLSQYPAQRAA